MKYIIDGYLYDTETARELCRVTCGLMNTITYYKTQKGNYFKVARTLINTSACYVRENEVKKALMGNNVEAYIELFGRPEEA